ncbi:MAG: hypothetical protein AB7L90_06035 [Hyphomicrobiaceae bacterium]
MLKEVPKPSQDRDNAAADASETKSMAPKVRLGDSLSPWANTPKVRLGDSLMPW